MLPSLIKTIIRTVRNATKGSVMYGTQVNDEGWTMYGARTAKEMFQEFTEHLNCTVGDPEWGEPNQPAAKLASWKGGEVSLVCDACHVIIAGLTFEPPLTERD